jgi:hypothetical protein
MTHVIFLGPSLPLAEARALHPEAVFLPPARQGDIVSVLRLYQPSAIGLIDGVFLDVLSIWHKEILLALDGGVAMLGASSMGALRAAECAPFGMVGLGRIHGLFADGVLDRDDEVAVAHATAEFHHRSLSEPLVNLRLNLMEAAATGVLEPSLANALIAEAAALYFPDRSWQRVFASPLLDAAQRQALERFVRERAVDHKAVDARLLLRTMAAMSAEGSSPGPAEPATPPNTWTLERSHYLEALVERDRWSPHQGEPISQEAIARHALVNDPRAPELVRQGLVELLALYAARTLGVEADAADLQRVRAAFMAERHLGDGAALAAFFAANDLTEAEGERLLADQATLETACEWLRLSRFKLGVARPLLDAYRRGGTYPEWADAAARAQALQGRGPDGLPERIPLPSLPAAEQVARHARETGWRAPSDLLAWSQRYGFLHSDALLMEIERSRQARLVQTPETSPQVGHDRDS